MMKIIVISYSLTGNNKALANSIAAALGAEYFNVSESKKRTNATIVFDFLFNRTPEVKPIPDILKNFEQVIFLGPVWMGQVATPLRVYFRYLKDNPVPYAFISLSGGADGGNPKLEDELFKRVGRKPEVLLDLHITDLLPTDPKPDRNTTSAYKVNEKDLKALTATALQALETMKERKARETKKIQFEPFT